MVVAFCDEWDFRKTDFWKGIESVARQWKTSGQMKYYNVRDYWTLAWDNFCLLKKMY